MPIILKNPSKVFVKQLLTSQSLGSCYAPAYSMKIRIIGAKKIIILINSVIDTFSVYSTGARHDTPGRGSIPEISH